MVILKPSLESEEVDKTLSRIEKAIKKAKGKLGKIDKWGKRKLAYPIKGQNDGYYAIVTFNGNGEVVRELDRVLKISDEVIRHLTVKLESKPS
jgi:small subunit ribosomal protein S6